VTQLNETDYVQYKDDEGKKAGFIADASETPQLEAS